MIGAIAGDIIGSVYEWAKAQTTEFPLFQDNSAFTDDTVLTVAVAYAIVKKKDYGECLKLFGRAYPYAGYGLNFQRWLFSESSGPYNSYGNGSAMRVSPVGFAFNSVDEVLDEAKKSAEVTHNHSEGVKGAQATALAIFLPRTRTNKEVIKEEISERFAYDLDRRLCDIREVYGFNESCQGTVPEAIISFLESNSFEDAIRKAISLGGDSDTLACITGGIAQAYYKGVPSEIVTEVQKRLPKELLDVVSEFNARYID